jgi:hypothetical protein
MDENLTDESTPETEEVVLDFQVSTKEGSQAGHYPTDEHGCLRMGNTYTGPTPRKYDRLSQKNTRYPINEKDIMQSEVEYTGPVPPESVDVHQKNSDYTVDNNGTLIEEDGLFTGPAPVELKNQSAKNNTKYAISTQGTFSDNDCIYTGPTPNESAQAKATLKLYDAIEAQKEEDYDKLKKKQRKNLRHAGYKYKPKNTVLINN